MYCNCWYLAVLMKDCNRHFRSFNGLKYHLRNHHQCTESKEEEELSSRGGSEPAGSDSVEFVPSVSEREEDSGEEKDNREEDVMIEEVNELEEDMDDSCQSDEHETTKKDSKGRSKSKRKVRVYQCAGVVSVGSSVSKG